MTDRLTSPPLDPTTKVWLCVELRQADVLCKALDFFARFGTGQLEEIEHDLRTAYWTAENDNVWRVVRKHVDDIKALVFGHPPNGSWGIHSPKVPQAAREAYDILQILRKVVAVARRAAREEMGMQWVGGFVDFSDYLPTNPEWPPIRASTPGLWVLVTEHETPDGPVSWWWGDTPPTSAAVMEMKEGTLIFGGSSDPTGNVVRMLGTREACDAEYRRLNEADWPEWLAAWKARQQ